MPPTEEEKNAVRRARDQYEEHCENLWQDYVFKLEMQLGLTADEIEEVD